MRTPASGSVGLLLLAASVTMLLAAGGVMAQSPTPAVPTAKDIATVERLIATVGKKPIIELLRAKRDGRITISVDGREREAVGPPNEQFVTAQTILRDLGRIPLTVAKLEEALKTATPPPARKVAITQADAPQQSDADRSVFVTSCPEDKVKECAEEGFRDRFAVVNADAGLGHYTTWQEATPEGELQNRMEFSGSYTPPSDLAPYHGTATWTCTKGECQVTLVIPKVGILSR